MCGVVPQRPRVNPAAYVEPFVSCFVWEEPLMFWWCADYRSIWIAGRGWRVVLHFIGHKLTQLHVSWSPFLSLFHLGNPVKFGNPRVVHVLLCGTSPTTEADHMHRMVWCGVVFCAAEVFRHHVALSTLVLQASSVGLQEAKGSVRGLVTCWRQRTVAV